MATLYKSCGPSTKYPTSKINATSGVPTFKIPLLRYICMGWGPRALRREGRGAAARAWWMAAPWWCGERSPPGAVVGARAAWLCLCVVVRRAGVLGKGVCGRDGPIRSAGGSSS